MFLRRRSSFSLDSDLRSGWILNARGSRSLTRSYRVREFAELAGVTVKALHYYDRLDLLKPARKSSGYRVYAEKDLERLEQIVALKFLGFSLRQIKDILDRPRLDLSDALALQRRAIETK